MKYLMMDLKCKNSTYWNFLFFETLPLRIENILLLSSCSLHSPFIKVLAFILCSTLTSFL